MTFPDSPLREPWHREHDFYAYFRKPSFWLIILVFGLIVLFQYADEIHYTSVFPEWANDFGLSRHAFHRILFLLPIVWAGFLFGWQGSLAVSFISLAAMLPRVLVLSDNPIDAALEASTVFAIGCFLSAAFISLRKERSFREDLEAAQEDLKSSEQRYRQLFEYAGDSIVVHTLDGKVIAVNKATEMMTGYTQEELVNTPANIVLGDSKSISTANRVRDSLLNGLPIEQPYEQTLTCKNGNHVDMQISTSLIYEKGKPVAFQHIGRDVTEQKRLDENLRFYIKQATRAQEEERKRISMELHDDTIQALIVLSRKLDALTTVREGITPEVHDKLEDLWQQTDNILQGVRRLSQNLRPAMIDRLGLLPSIEWLADNLKEYSGVDTSVEYIGEEHRLPEEVAVALFRVTQEALSNVGKHSKATKAEVTVEFEDKLARVTVSDNGQGFDLPGKTGDLAKYGKLGLAGMQERAQLVGGKLEVVSQPGKGTTIMVEAPG